MDAEPDPKPEQPVNQGFDEMREMRARVAPVMNEFCEAWCFISVRVGTGQAFLFGEGQEDPRRRAILEEAIVLTATNILAVREQRERERN